MRLDVLAVVSAGGALGALARYGVGEALPTQPGRFPWATFAVNVSGCLLMGVLMVLVLEVWPPRGYVRPFVAIGVLGGYTTFSTYAMEARDLLDSAHYATAGSYVAGSVVATLAAVWLGAAGTRLLATRRGRSR